jgi:hypothetical protein
LQFCGESVQTYTASLLLPVVTGVASKLERERSYRERTPRPDSDAVLKPRF